MIWDFLLIIYVNDIILTNSDEVGISITKSYLKTHFAIRDLQTSRYFFEIEFALQ